jgi:predicted nuclease with TOPRIM domain
MPSDEQIRDVIERLESEREELRRREGASDPNLEQDAARLEEIRVELDQLWDLLRQRQALRDAGDDPDKAHERSSATVERYWQ